MQQHALPFLLLLGLPGQLALASPPDTATEPAPVFFRAPAHTLCLEDSLRVRTHSLANAPFARVQVSFDVQNDRALAHLAMRLWLRSYEMPVEDVTEEEADISEGDPAAAQSDDEATADTAPEIIQAPLPPPPSIHQQLAALGARYTLVDGPDALTLSMVVPSAKLPSLLALQQRLLREPLANVTDADLQHARQEWQDATLDPDQTLWRAAHAALAPADHPYQGSNATPSLDEVQAFTASAFSTERVMMTISADLSALDNPQKSIQQALNGDLTGFVALDFLPSLDEETENADDGATEPTALRVAIATDACITSLPTQAGWQIDQPAQPAVTIPAVVDSPEALLVWPLPPAYSDDDGMWELFPVITEEFVYQALQRKAPPGGLPSDVVSCQFLGGAQASAIACRVPVNRDGDQARAGRQFVTANDTMWYPDALTRLKEAFPDLQNRLRGRMLLRAADDVDGDPQAMAWHGSYDRITGDTFPLNARMSALDDLEPRAVLEAYRTWMNPERMAVVSLVPAGQPADLLADPLANAMTVTAPWMPLPPPWEPPAPQPLDPDAVSEADEEDEAEPPLEEEGTEADVLTVADLEALAENPMLTGVRRESLPNGMGLIIVERPGYPVVRATLIHRGGALRSESPVIDEMAWRTSTVFSDDEDGPFVPMWPLDGQATWQRERTAGAWISGLTGPAGNIEGLMYILSESVRSVAADPLQQKDYAYYTGRRYRPTAWQALHLLSRDAFFGPTAAISAPRIDAKMRKSATIVQADAWAKAVVSPQNTTLVVISPLTNNEVRGAARAAFLDWTNEQAAPSLTAPTIQPRQTVLVMDSPHSTAQVNLRCPLGSSEADDPAARMLLSDMLALSLWENNMDSQPTSLSLNVAEMENGTAWLQARYSTTPEQAGQGIANFRTTLSETLADLEEQLERDALEVTRLELLDTVTVALEADPRPNRSERTRLSAIVSAIEALPVAEMAVADLTEQLAFLQTIVDEGAELPEPEPEEETTEGDEPILVDVPYIPAPRPTLDDARQRRAQAHASAYSTPDAITAQFIAEHDHGRPWMDARQLAGALMAVDTLNLTEQLRSCVGHDVISVYAPAEATTASLQAAGLTVEVLDLKEHRSR